MEIIRVKFSGFKNLEKVHEFGWKTHDLFRLSQIMRTIIRKLRKLSPGMVGYTAEIGKRHPEIAENAFRIDNKAQKIYVYLSPGPQFVLENAPLLISTLLIHQFLTTDPNAENFFLRLRSKIKPKTADPTDQSIEAISEYFEKERNDIFHDRLILYKLFTLLSKSLELKIFTHALAFDMLFPHPFSSRPLIGAVEETIPGINENLSDISTNIDTFKVFGNIAFLAMSSVLAQKAGSPETALGCRGILLGERGQKLAAKIAAFDIDEKDPQYYSNLKEEKAYKLLAILFNNFGKIFDHYWEAARID